MKHAPLAAVALAFLPAVSGCTVTVNDRTDVELVGWQVNGQPADAAACDLFEVGIVSFEFEDQFGNVIGPFDFDCSDGVRTFLLENALRPGDEYQAFVSAFDLLPNEVGQFPLVDDIAFGDPFVAFSDVPVTIGASDLPNLQRPRFEITWDAAGFSCQQARVDEIVLDLVFPGEDVRRPVAFACSPNDGYVMNIVDVVDSGITVPEFPDQVDLDLLIDGFVDGDAVPEFAQRCEGVLLPTRSGSFFCDNVQKL